MIVFRALRLLGYFFLGIAFGGFLVVKSANAGWRINVPSFPTIYLTVPTLSCADVLKGVNYTQERKGIANMYSSCSSDPVTAGSTITGYALSNNSVVSFTLGSITGADDYQPVNIMQVGSYLNGSALPIKLDPQYSAYGLPVDLQHNSILTSNAVPVSSTASGGVDTGTATVTTIVDNMSLQKLLAVVAVCFSFFLGVLAGVK